MHEILQRSHRHQVIVTYGGAFVVGAWSPMPIAFAGYARFHGPRRHEYAAGPTSRRSVSDGAAFYRKDFTLDLGPDGKPVGSRSDFVRGPDGKVAWWRNHGGLHGCQEQLG